MNEQQDKKESETAFENKDIQRAWAYHQNADTIQHQRHILFILAQTIFFAGFGASKNTTVQWLVLVLGSIFAFLWWKVAEVLELRLDAMRSILKQDRVWKLYIDAVPQKAWFRGRNVFNRLLPGLTLIAWICLLVFLIFQASPGGPANGSQPIGSATNQTSSAAGSRR